MKLVAVLMLTALPLSCFAGPGCDLLEKVITKTLCPAETPEEYLKLTGPFISDEATAKAMVDKKKCFLEQSNETLNNINEMLHYIYNSPWCASY